LTLSMFFGGDRAQMGNLRIWPSAEAIAPITPDLPVALRDKHQTAWSQA
jgi:hypothetical protein